MNEFLRSPSLSRQPPARTGDALVDDARDRAPVRALARRISLPRPHVHPIQAQVRTDIARRLHPVIISQPHARRSLSRHNSPANSAQTAAPTATAVPTYTHTRQPYLARGKSGEGGEKEGGRTSPHSQREKMSGGFPELLARSAIASAMRLYSVGRGRECAGHTG